MRGRGGERENGRDRRGVERESEKERKGEGKRGKET